MIFTPTVESLDHRIEENSQHYGRFKIAPLDKGQAITIANAIRRTLISTLDGVGITSVQIKNCSKNLHEYSTIPGIQDSVFELLLNLKDLVLSSKIPLENFEAQKCFLKVNEVGVVTAESIQFPSTVEVINPDQYITTITSPDCLLDLEITIEKGHGSNLQGMPTEDSSEEDPILPVESIFTPVKRVNFVIEDYILQRGKKIEKEMIILECWTNGSIEPKVALNQSIQNLIDLFQFLVGEERKSEPKTEVVIPVLAVKDEKSYEKTLIEELGLSVRSYNCLKSTQIHTVGDLLDYSIENLLEIKNFGAKSAEEVVKVLQNQLGLDLPPSK